MEGKVGPVHALKTYRGKRGPTSLAPHVGIQWRGSPSYHKHLPPNETTPSIHRIGCWLGPRAQLDLLEKRNIFYPCQEVNYDCPASHMPVMTPSFCHRYRRKEKHQCCYQQSVQLLYDWDQRVAPPVVEYFKSEATNIQQSCDKLRIKGNICAGPPCVGTQYLTGRAYYCATATDAGTSLTGCLLWMQTHFYRLVTKYLCPSWPRHRDQNAFM